MRVFGYPPGWIEDIKQSSSVLDFIDAPSSSSCEEDERGFTYNVDRLIDFPGFNAPLERGVRDVIFRKRAVLLCTIINESLCRITGLAVLELSSHAEMAFQRSFDRAIEESQQGAKNQAIQP